jgi:pyruvate formate lyase activating enzyme
MQIGGILKTTLLDYPDKVACIVFTVGCNFRCGFCHNPDLVDPKRGSASNLEAEPQLIPEEYFFTFLESRKKIIDGVVITGGEPTLQKDLKDFIIKVKAKGFLVKLDTNGTNPELLKELIEQKLVDYIAMDLKTLPEKYSSIVSVKVDPAKILRSINILLGSKIDYEFRTTVVEGLHTKADLINMAKLISGAKKYYLQKFRASEKLLNNDFKEKKSLKQSELEEIALECRRCVKECEVR